MKKTALLFAVLIIITISASARELNLTIYNDNLALIKDFRQEYVSVGEKVQLAFTNVSALIDPSSVHLKSQADIIEQNFQYDLINQNRLLQKYIGERIRIKQDNNVIEGILLSTQGGLIIEQDNKKLILSPEGEVELPALPEGLILKPTLSWLLNNKTTGLQQIELSYLSRGLSWEADYVLQLSADETSAALNGWVTIHNNSGSGYPDASVQLIAGTPHQVAQTPPARLVLHMEKAGAGTALSEEAFFEYHLYELQHKTTLNNAETKQISLMKVSNINLNKKYVLENSQTFALGQIHKQNPDVKLVFNNSSKNGLGTPLPKGKIRIYKADSKDRLQFAGEDIIEHTPKDELITITAGNVFDITTERVLKEDVRVNDRQYEKTIEVTIANHKDTDIVIDIKDTFYRAIKVLNSSHKYKLADAKTAVFTISVPKNSKTTLRYAVLI
ncbi:MAG: DUF4139 domain-containing protein [Candidatus Margulisiibacteriota bacterium]